MTARRLVLAWSAGATVGYLVGWLAGSNVQRLREARSLASDRRAARAFLAAEGAAPTPEQRARARAVAPVRLPKPRRGAGTGTSATEALNAALRGAERFPFPAQRLPLDDDTEAQAWLDAGRCAAVSPGGGLRCIVTGPHTGHWWEAVYAPDRKDDADERIE